MRRLILILAATVFAGGILLAEEEEFEKGKGPCMQDAKKICQGIKPGDGRIRACLKENESKLSAACKERIAKAREHKGHMREACKADFQQHCKGVKKEGAEHHAGMKCLMANKDKLSAACREHLEKMQEHRKNRK